MNAGTWRCQLVLSGAGQRSVSWFTACPRGEAATIGQRAADGSEGRFERGDLESKPGNTRWN